MFVKRPPPLNSITQYLAAMSIEEKKEETVAELLFEFERNQELRPRVYKHWETAFNIYLKTGDLQTYQTIVKAATDNFATISNNIKKIASKLQDTKGADIATVIIEELQQKEKTQLQRTIQMQLLVEENSKKRDDYEGFEEAVMQRRIEEAQRNIAESITEINEVLDQIRIMKYELQDV
mmetsp:Transcript_16233/g.18064  ORF Transcript_16233/g.18064 Transcript_16233/m.18064 type:complete len:179 (+) Transcript_16233:25-561(+)